MTDWFDLSIFLRMFNWACSLPALVFVYLQVTGMPDLWCWHCPTKSVFALHIFIVHLNSSIGSRQSDNSLIRWDVSSLNKSSGFRYTFWRSLLIAQALTGLNAFIFKKNSFIDLLFQFDWCSSIHDWYFFLEKVQIKCFHRTNLFSILITSGRIQIEK